MTHYQKRPTQHMSSCRHTSTDLPARVTRVYKEFQIISTLKETFQYYSNLNSDQICHLVDDNTTERL